MKKSNHLISESSKYLLQHAYNPVDWYPWSSEAFDKAKDENKLLIISIGYSTCHWCHVMEKESFEDTEVANIMNKYFVSIKVDREERPDIDNIYMTAAQLITGRGGWPLNVIALPNGKPIYAATYFPKDGWINLLEQVIKIKQTNYNDLVEQAERLSEGIIDSESMKIESIDEEFNPETVDKITSKIISKIDFEFGGFKRAPKFPLPNSFSFLLNELSRTNNLKIKKAIEITLDNLSSGGIFDHIEGGFFRYSTDARWIVPHFEKMLYDNAQLLSLFSNYYRYSKNKKYLETANKTYQFLINKLYNDGAFYSAIDADSEGEEGKYYIWNYSELENIIRNNFDIFSDLYNIQKHGNWEGNIILTKKDEIAKITDKYNITVEQLYELDELWTKKLLNERKTRKHPLIDDKIILSWNSLALIGLSDYYHATKNNDVKITIIKTANFIKDNFIYDGYKLNRIFANGKSKIAGKLDDYAFTISAFIKVYEVTLDETWLMLANNLLKYCNNNFLNQGNNFYNFTEHTDEKLIVKSNEIIDNVIPSSNSQMAINLYVLGTYFNNFEYIEHSKILLGSISNRLVDGAEFFSNWSYLYSMIANGSREIIITGENACEITEQLTNNFIPYLILGASDTDSKMPLIKGRIKDEALTIFVCKNRVCELPVHTLDEAINLLNR